MDDDREAFEFAYALYLSLEVDAETAQIIVDAAEVGYIMSGCCPAVMGVSCSAENN